MRFIIGIDLGTTNSAVAFVDTQKKHLPVEMFSVPQLVAEGHMETRSTLPSFCYLGDTEKVVVGQWAKIQGARVPTRMVQSAKSWLCNAAVERKERILPVEAADISRRMSPVEASAAYLKHLKDAWNRTIAKGDAALLFEEQEIILTVPASFDEVARNLTVEAARQASLSHVTLLEEPQAAFYSWITQHEKVWETEFRFKEGQSILVCDVGGGTTDFSLIEIHAKEEKLTFQRMAVGDHLLLGGDNMDAALAHYLERKLERPLEGTQWLQLLSEARAAKEELLSSDQKSSYTIALQGKGSAVVGGSVATTIKREEVEKLLGEGFFGLYPLQEAVQLKKSPGLRSMGLPYENEPSITKHLAHFLKQAHYLEPGKGIDFILFNGGTLKPALFQNALIQSLHDWYPERKTKVLPTASLDLAVARGAAYYGKVRRGFGVAIEGGLPRTYYLELDVKGADGQTERLALTLLPRGSQEGYEFQPEHLFTLRANAPVSFNLLTSHVRLHDRAGEMIAIEENEMQKLPPIQTILRFGRKQGEGESHQLIPVHIGLRLTAVGTVELWVASQKTDHHWNLEFQWRSATGQDHHLLSHEEKKQDETFASGYLNEAKESITAFYAGSLKPSKLMEQLEELLHQNRKEWSTSVLRELWTPLIAGAYKRKSSAVHEARFWNLAGFLLRPGYGYPLDDFRVKELWKLILADLKSPFNQEIQIAHWICFRRIAGGLNKGQQMQLASELTSQLIDKKTGKFAPVRPSSHYAYSEKIRALAALEKIDVALKVKLGDALLAKIERQEGDTCDYWSLARLGARHLVYASAGHVVARDICSRWVEKLLEINHTNSTEYMFALTQLARKCDQRELNLSEKLIEKILLKHPELQKNILEERSLSSSEEAHIFGEQLPPGLLLELATTRD
jgi:molecular chaperone DnaK (HSP70)